MLFTNTPMSIFFIILSAFEFDCILNKFDIDIVLPRYDANSLPESQTMELTQI